MRDNVYKAPAAGLSKQEPGSSYSEPTDPLERFLGNMVDGFTIVLPLALVFVVFTVSTGVSVEEIPRPTIQLGAYSAIILAQAAFEASSLQATPGKRWQGMRVFDAAGRAPAFWRTLLRNAFKWILLGLMPPIGLFAYLDSQRRMPWDRLSGTVVRQQPDGADDLDEEVVYLDID